VQPLEDVGAPQTEAEILAAFRATTVVVHRDEDSTARDFYRDNAHALGLTGAAADEHAKQVEADEHEAGIVRTSQRHDARMALRLTSRRDESLVVRAITTPRQRGVSRERHPQGRKGGASSASRDGPRRSDEPERPLELWRGVFAASTHMRVHLQRRAAAMRTA
jgi:hypothetical protein